MHEEFNIVKTFLTAYIYILACILFRLVLRKCFNAAFLAPRNQIASLNWGRRLGKSFPECFVRRGVIGATLYSNESRHRAVNEMQASELTSCSPHAEIRSNKCKDQRGAGF